MPVICQVPDRLDYPNLADALEALALPFDPEEHDDIPVLDLSANTFCDPSGTVALAAFCADYARRHEHPLRLEGWDPTSYLSRVGFKPLAGYKDDYPKRRHENGDQVTSIMEVVYAPDRAETLLRTLDVLDVAHEGCRQLLGYCLEEILRNVEEHADSPVNALIQAQHYSARGNVVVAIGDTGRGVLLNMRQRHPDLEDDLAALQLAMEPGMSGRNPRKGSNAGLGLTVSSALIARAGGTFQIVSGNAMLEITSRGTLARQLPSGGWRGVLVVMCVPRNDALPWGEIYKRTMLSFTRR
jgi:hypothetical protein